MKTLVNKNNPQIRITAPEITTAHPPVSNEGYVYWIPAINEMYSPIDWTLVEEEPVKQTSKYLQKPDYDERVVKKMSKELAKIITDQIAEPVDLENEAVAFCFDNGINVTPHQATRFARHFYELGQIAQIEQNKALATQVVKLSKEKRDSK